MIDNIKVWEVSEDIVAGGESVKEILDFYHREIGADYTAEDVQLLGTLAEHGSKPIKIADPEPGEPTQTTYAESVQELVARGESLPAIIASNEF